MIKLRGKLLATYKGKAESGDLAHDHFRWLLTPGTVYEITFYDDSKKNLNAIGIQSIRHVVEGIPKGELYNFVESARYPLPTYYFYVEGVDRDWNREGIND